MTTQDSTQPKAENTSPTNARVQSILATLFVLFAATTVSLVLAECLARWYLMSFANGNVFLTYASERQLVQKYGSGNSKFAAHPYLIWIPRPNWTRGPNKHNSLGFRGDEFPVAKPAGEFRIACLGSSTTYTSAVEDYRMSYPAQLEVQLREQHPNTRVINAGTSGWTTWEDLINFETRVLDLSPDLVIVYEGINDFEDRLVWPPEAYRGDDSGSRAAPQRDINMPHFLEYSTLARYALIRLGFTRPHSRLERLLVRPRSSLLIEYRVQLRKGTYPKSPFDKIPVEQIRAANPPIYFKRNLEHLIAIGRMHNVKVVLATMATAPVEARLDFAAPQDIAAIEEMNDTTRTVAAKMGVPLFDFARVFPKDAMLFADGVHVNEKGAQLTAKYIGEFLQREGLIR